MDIVVESPDVIIGIEVKIDAGDQKEQLHDYFKELNQRARGQKRAVLVYLTLDGKPPSGRTLGGLEQEVFVACRLQKTSASGSATVLASVNTSQSCLTL